MVLVRVAPQREGPVAAPHRRADRTHPEQLLQPVRQVGAVRPGVPRLPEQPVLAGAPGSGLGILGVLEPAERVGDLVPVDHVDDHAA
jgi:hypothetical protein